MVRQRVSEIIKSAVEKARSAGLIPDVGEDVEVVVDLPKRPEWGDFATPVALVLAQKFKKNPREIAAAIHSQLEVGTGLLDKADIAGAGFINLTLSNEFWQSFLKQVLDEGQGFGRQPRNGKKVLVEFVSANPTGPLHVGHARNAVVGDVVASLLDAAGWDVEREFYVNDVGGQIENLGRSVWLRYGELRGFLEFPEIQ